MPLHAVLRLFGAGQTKRPQHYADRNIVTRLLSQRGRYALKAMLSLAREIEGRPKHVGAIAADENIPRKFLEGIMASLRRERLIEAHRGNQGGYRLARPAELITFGHVMCATEGPLALVACADYNFYKRCDDCRDEATCALRRVMIDVRREMSDILDRTTLADADGMR